MEIQPIKLVYFGIAKKNPIIAIMNNCDDS